MGADASRLSVSDDQRFTERVAPPLCRGQIAGLAGAGQREAGRHSLKAGLWQIRTMETFSDSARNRRKTEVESKAQVRRAGDSLAKRLPRKC
jgi:hypothetical protein